MSERAIVIDRPVDEVYGFFADAENDPQWRPGVASIRRNGDLVVGTTYSQEIEGPGGRLFSADLRVTELALGRAVGFVVTTGPVRPRGRYRFIAVGPSATEVTFSLDPGLSWQRWPPLTRRRRSSSSAPSVGLGDGDGARKSRADDRVFGVTRRGAHSGPFGGLGHFASPSPDPRVVSRSGRGGRGRQGWCV